MSDWVIALVPVVLLGTVFVLGFTGCQLGHAVLAVPSRSFVVRLEYDRSIASVASVEFVLTAPPGMNHVTVDLAGMPSRPETPALGMYAGSFTPGPVGMDPSPADNTFQLTVSAAQDGSWSVGVTVNLAPPGSPVSLAAAPSLTVPFSPDDVPILDFRFRPASGGGFEVVRQGSL